MEECKKMVQDTIKNKTAVKYLKKMVELQGGDSSVIEDTNNFEKSSIMYELISEQEGYISKMDTEKIGICSVHLGAGRLKKEDSIDYTAGIILGKKYAEYVKKGDVLATFFTNDESVIEKAKQEYLGAITFSNEKPKQEKLIYALVTKDDVIKF